MTKTSLEIRSLLAKCQLRPQGINTPSLIHAVEQVERELFIPKKLQHLAYSDIALSLEYERIEKESDSLTQQQKVAQRREERQLDTIFDVAFRIEKSGIEERIAHSPIRILDFSVATGYSSALLGTMVNELEAALGRTEKDASHVVAYESNERLKAQADENLERYEHVSVTSDLSSLASLSFDIVVLNGSYTSLEHFPIQQWLAPSGVLIGARKVYTGVAASLEKVAVLSDGSLDKSLVGYSNAPLNLEALST